MEENTQPKGTVGTEALATTTRAQHAGGGGAKAVPEALFGEEEVGGVSGCCGASRWSWWHGSCNVTAARLSQWRDRALLAAEAALKERERDDRDDEIARLKGKVGEMTMETELLREKIARLEAGGPLARRRSRP